MSVWTKNVFTVIACLAIVTGGTSVSLAQTGGYQGAFTRMGFDPVGVSIGQGVSAWPSKHLSGYWNPAFTALDSDTIRVWMNSSLLRFDRRLNSAEIRFPLPPNAGFAIQVIQAGVKDIDSRTVSGYPGDLIETGELQFSGVFGLRISEALKAGIAIKWTSSKLHESVPRSSTVGVDVGVLAHIGRMHHISVVLKDLLASYDWDTGELYGSNQRSTVKESFPTRFIVGHSVEFTKDRPFAVASEVEWRRQVQRVPEWTLEISPIGISVFSTTREELDSALLFRSGFSLAVHEKMNWRAGFSTTDVRLDPRLLFSTGFSLDPGNIPLSPKLHYSFSEEPSKSTFIHMIALDFAF